MTKKRVYWYLFVHEQWRIYLGATPNGLCYVGAQNGSFEELINWIDKHLPQYDVEQNKSHLQSYMMQFREYFKGERCIFTFPKDLYGTDFQLSVWHTVYSVSYGSMSSYLDIANKLQKIKSVRAIAIAIRANPLLIVIPCHRVNGKNGVLTNYRSGLGVKKRLITLEQNTFNK